MRFYNREKEIGVLERAVAQKGSAMVVISGRRRVGKSRLADEFLRKKGFGLKVVIVPKEERQVATDLAAAFSNGFKPSFSTVKEAFEYFFAKSTERLLYIDEFSNFLEVNPSIPFELQRLWDTYKDRTDKVLILSGSYASMMDKIFTRQKAPLFNRASFKIILEPLNPSVIWAMQEDLGVKNAAEKITNYCVYGGIPYYYEVIEKFGRPLAGLEELFFGVGQLREEGQNILRQEFGAAYKKYFSILEAIGAGLVSGGEIASKIGLQQTTLSKYMQSLQNDYKLIERIVPFGQNPNRSKKGAYAIKDNMLAFWFKHVYGKRTPPAKDELGAFVGRRFELLCAEFLAGLLQERGEKIVRAGRWWGQLEVEKGVFEQREIDLVIETEKHVYAGECKWSNGKMGSKELERLKGSAKALKTKKPLKFALFSKAGFLIKENEEVLLFDPASITSHKSKA